ncbi:MAG TPA: NADH-quinone oxidoreductase subunit C [Actinomycetota bacterium]|nr:NADH-quinone oxidoreductase subunit C [Actinomycetota bacterium]
MGHRTPGDVRSAFTGRFADAARDIDARDQIMLGLPPDRRPEALALAKELGFTFYVFCAGVDWPEAERMEVLDQVFDPHALLRLTLRYDLPRTKPVLPSGTGVYAGANWYERETYELFGIGFTGHPRLSRLFLPDWFEGHPLRKDFELEARVEKPWPGASFEG